MIFVVKNLLLLVPFFFFLSLTEFNGVSGGVLSPPHDKTEKAPVFDTTFSDDEEFEPIPNLFGPLSSPSHSNSPVQSPHQSPQVSAPSSPHHSAGENVGSSSSSRGGLMEEGKRPSRLNVQRPMPFANYVEKWEQSPGTYSPTGSISPPKKAEALNYNFGREEAAEEETEDWSKKSPFTDYESPKAAAASSSSSSSKVVPKHSASIFTVDSPTNISPEMSPMGSQRWEDKFKTSFGHDDNTIKSFTDFREHSRQQETLQKQPSMDENPFAEYVEAESPTGSHVSFGEVESPKPDDKFTNRFRNGQSNDHRSTNLYPLSAQQQHRGLDQDMIAGRMRAQLDSEWTVEEEEEHEDESQLALELILYKYRRHLPGLFAPVDKDSHFAPLQQTTALLMNTLKSAAAKWDADSTDLIEVLVTMSNEQRRRMLEVHGYSCDKITKIKEVSKSPRYRAIMSSLCTMDRDHSFWHDEEAAMETARQIDDYLVKYETAKAGGSGKGGDNSSSSLDKQTSSSLLFGKPVYDDDDSPGASARRFDSPKASAGKSAAFGGSSSPSGTSFRRRMLSRTTTTGWSLAAREEEKGKVEMEHMIAKVMAETNYSQLRLIFEQTPNGMTLGQRLEGLKKNSHFLQVLRAFATDVHQGRPHFFALLLKQKLEKLVDLHSLNDADAHWDICRILVTRAQIDLPDIVDAFTDIVYSVSLVPPKSASVSGLLPALNHVFAHQQKGADKARLKAYIQIVQLYQYAGEGNSISRKQITPFGGPGMFIDVATVPDIFDQGQFHPKLTNTHKPDGMQLDPLNNGAAYYPLPLVGPNNNVYPLSMDQLHDSVDQEIMERRILSQLGERIEQGIDRTNELRMELILYKYRPHLGELFSKDGDLDVDHLLPITLLLKKTVDTAIGKWDADSTDLIEVLVTMTNEQRKHLHEKYKVEGTADFCKKICQIKEVKKSERYQKMMHELCSRERDQSFARSEQTAVEYQYAGEGNTISRKQITPFGGPGMFIDVATVPDIFDQGQFHPKLTNTHKPDGMQLDPLNNGAAYYPLPLVGPNNNVYPLSMDQLHDSVDQEIMERRILSQLGERIEQGIDRTNELRMELILYKYRPHLGELFSKDGDLDVDHLLPITLLLKKTVDTAIGKWDPDSTDLIEVLVTMTNEQRKHLHEKYKVEGTADFCKKICQIKEVKKSERYQKMMHELCSRERDQSFARSEETAMEIAEKIYEHLSSKKKGKKNGNEDLDQLIAQTMAEKNFSQLRTILGEKPIRERATEMLGKEPKSHFLQVLNAVLTDVKDGRPHFFAQLLAQKLAKLVDNSGGNDADAHWDICRIFVGRAPIDLADILDLVDKMPVKYSKRENVEGLDEILKKAMKKAGAGDKPKVAAYKEIVRLVRGPEWRVRMARQFNQHLAIKRLALLPQ